MSVTGTSILCRQTIWLVGVEDTTTTRTQVFGDLLRAHRQAAGLTQEQLAECANLSARAVGDLERGAKLRPHRTTIQLLISALGLTGEQLSDFELAARNPSGSLFPHAFPVADLAASYARRHNLPAALTSFIGRTHELTDVAQRVSNHRLVTLTGVGGVGKTRLATEVGIQAVQSSGGSAFADGVWLVELAEVLEAALIPAALVRTFRLPAQIGQPPLDLLLEYLADKQLLLILDNCEHLSEACAEIVDRLLSHCWRVHVLATSREELRIRGETTYALLPLPLANPLEDNPERLFASAAERLFVERIGDNHAVQQAYLEHAVTIAYICRQLDGIPLAIELAAPLARSIPLGEIAAQLHNQMAILTNTYRNAIPRHQTMHSALAWSYQLLAPTEQRVLDSVSVFAGGWTLEAAQAVCAGEKAELLLSFQQLVAKSLVVAENIGEQMRYRLLEPVRQFAREHLVASGAQETVCRRHADYFLSMAEKLAQVHNTRQEREWLDIMWPERANLHAVNSWAIERGEVEFAHRFNGLLFSFWIYSRSESEGHHWLGTILELKAAVPTAATLTAEARALDTAGYLATVQHGFAQALAWFERELTIYTALNDHRGIASALRGCAFAAMLAGDLTQAGHRYDQSLVICRANKDHWGEAWSLYELGYLALVRGDTNQAAELLAEGLSQLRARQMVLGEFRALVGLGHTMRLMADPERARGFYREALHIHQEMHFYVPFIADCLEGLAGMAADEGDPSRAARLFGAVQAYRTAVTSPRWPHLGRQYERDMAQARSLLLAETWDDVWAEGSRMSLEQAVTYALAADLLATAHDGN
jgi:predicted ATPase/transcriptional regulator with XRE-family HTH domain